MSEEASGIWRDGNLARGNVLQVTVWEEYMGDNEKKKASNLGGSGESGEKTIACGKCLGVLYSVTDSKGYRKQVPKCLGISQHVKMGKDDLRKLQGPRQRKMTKEEDNMITTTLVFGTSVWAKGVDMRTNQKTFFVFPGRSIEIAFGTKNLADDQHTARNDFVKSHSADSKLHRKPASSSDQNHTDASRSDDGSKLIEAATAWANRYVVATKTVLTYANYKKLWDKYWTRMDIFTSDFGGKMAKGGVRVVEVSAKAGRRIYELATGRE